MCGEAADAIERLRAGLSQLIKDFEHYAPIRIPDRKEIIDRARSALGSTG
jgi:hypothetical protein